MQSLLVGMGMSEDYVAALTTQLLETQRHGSQENPLAQDKKNSEAAEVWRTRWKQNREDPKTEKQFVLGPPRVRLTGDRRSSSPSTPHCPREATSHSQSQNQPESPSFARTKSRNRPGSAKYKRPWSANTPLSVRWGAGTPKSSKTEGNDDTSSKQMDDSYHGAGQSKEQEKIQEMQVERKEENQEQTVHTVEPGLSKTLPATFPQEGRQLILQEPDVKQVEQEEIQQKKRASTSHLLQSFLKQVSHADVTASSSLAKSRGLDKSLTFGGVGRADPDADEDEDEEKNRKKQQFRLKGPVASSVLNRIQKKIDGKVEKSVTVKEEQSDDVGDGSIDPGVWLEIRLSPAGPLKLVESLEEACKSGDPQVLHDSLVKARRSGIETIAGTPTDQLKHPLQIFIDNVTEDMICSDVINPWRAAFYRSLLLLRDLQCVEQNLQQSLRRAEDVNNTLQKEKSAAGFIRSQNRVRIVSEELKQDFDDALEAGLNSKAMKAASECVEKLHESAKVALAKFALLAQPVLERLKQATEEGSCSKLHSCLESVRTLDGAEALVGKAWLEKSSEISRNMSMGFLTGKMEGKSTFMMSPKKQDEAKAVEAMHRASGVRRTMLQRRLTKKLNDNPWSGLNIPPPWEEDVRAAVVRLQELKDLEQDLQAVLTPKQVKPDDAVRHLEDVLQKARTAGLQGSMMNHALDALPQMKEHVRRFAELCNRAAVRRSFPETVEAMQLAQEHGFIVPSPLWTLQRLYQKLNDEIQRVWNEENFAVIEKVIDTIQHERVVMDPSVLKHFHHRFPNEVRSYIFRKLRQDCGGTLSNTWEGGIALAGRCTNCSRGMYSPKDGWQCITCQSHFICWSCLLFKAVA